MNKGPVFVIDEDIDDQLFMAEAWDEMQLSNPLTFFKSAEEFLQTMETDPTVPFLIISEIRLPKMSGLELRKHLWNDESIKYKSIPFVLLTAYPTSQEIKIAYDVYTHGVFKKMNTLRELKRQMVHIVNYWADCIVPL